MNAFIDYLHSFSEVDQLLIGKLELIIRREGFLAGDYLLKPGKIPSRIYFLEQGLAKAFYAHADGRIEVRQFFKSPCLVWDAQAFLSRKPSQLSLQIITTSQLSSLSFGELQTLLQQSSQALRIARLVLADCMQQRDLRSFLSGLPLPERYRYFCQRFPCHQLAVQDIASYLYAYPTSISRLRRRL